jgi:hypothetical protein
MHRVVAAKVVLRREVPCSPGQRIVDRDDEESGVNGLEVRQSVAMTG